MLGEITGPAFLSYWIAQERQKDQRELAQLRLDDSFEWVHDRAIELLSDKKLSPVSRRIDRSHNNRIILLQKDRILFDDDIFDPYDRLYGNKPHLRMITHLVLNQNLDADNLYNENEMSDLYISREYRKCTTLVSRYGAYRAVWQLRPSLGTKFSRMWEPNEPVRSNACPNILKATQIIDELRSDLRIFAPNRSL